MLEKLRIQNFQNHAKSLFYLNQVTTFIGRTDVGKSAVIRALRLLVHNQPSGDHFIKDGTSGTTVTLNVDDHTIVRRRGKGTNEYILDGKELKSFGRDVPKEIEDALKIKPLNFQLQHDAPFWFSESGGQISRNLNTLIDLESMDQCIARSTKMVSKVRSEYQVTESRLESAKKELDQIKWIRKVDSEYKRIEEMRSDLVKCRYRYDSLISIASDCRSLEVIRCPDTREMDDLLLVIDESQKGLKSLTTLISEISELKDLKNPHTHDLDSLASQINKMRKRIRALGNMVDDIGDLQKQTMSLEKDIKDAHEEIERESEGLCPLCGKEIS